MKEKMNLTLLTKIEMKNLQGGYIICEDGGKTCGCGCYYSGSGGSSTGDNMGANNSGGLYSVPQRSESV